MTNPAPQVSIVVPTFRERPNLRPLTERIASAFKTPHEIIVVDDDSGDGSVEEVEKLKSEGFPIRIIVRRGERGLATAVMRGFDEAQAPVLACMDADLSHPPEKLPELLEPILSGRAEITVGSRYVPGGSTEQWTLKREIISRVAIAMARPLTRVRDLTAGFFALRKEAISGVALNPVGYKIGLEIFVKGKRQHPIVEVPFSFVDRVAGETKFGFKEQWNYLVHLLRLYWAIYPWAVVAVPVVPLAVLALALYYYFAS